MTEGHIGRKRSDNLIKLYHYLASTDDLSENETIDFNFEDDTVDLFLNWLTVDRLKKIEEIMKVSNLRATFRGGYIVVAIPIYLLTGEDIT